MNDLELKNLLLETCPVRPGQEERAWAALQPRLAPRVRGSAGNWLSLPFWKPLAYAAFGFLLAVLLFNSGALHPGRHALVFADSQSPGVYATSFYSNSAQAQVVWLNGMEPATDRPTYLDPTSAIPHHKESQPAQDPNSL
jgi:hypothetical protein